MFLSEKGSIVGWHVGMVHLRQSPANGKYVAASCQWQGVDG
jgi:hypothetical protein